MDPSSAPDAVAMLERRVRRVTVVLSLLMAAVLLLVAFAWVRLSPTDQLRLRALSIMDERGVERVRIAGQ